MMSTTFVLVPVGGDDASLPSLEITQSGLQFDLDCWSGDPDEPTQVEFTNLTANEVIAVALKMLQVVLYSYPELMPTIRAQLDRTRY